MDRFEIGKFLILHENGKLKIISTVNNETISIKPLTANSIEILSIDNTLAEKWGKI